MRCAVRPMQGLTNWKCQGALSVGFFLVLKPSPCLLALCSTAVRAGPSRRVHARVGPISCRHALRGAGASLGRITPRRSSTTRLCRSTTSAGWRRHTSAQRIDSPLTVGGNLRRLYVCVECIQAGELDPRVASARANKAAAGGDDGGDDDGDDEEGGAAGGGA